MTDVVALSEVDPVLAQQADRLLVADEFGDRALAEAARELDDRLDDRLIGLAAPQAGDEVAVDLEEVERQVSRASSMLAIAAVSVTSRIRFAGSIEAASSSSAIAAGRRESPMVRPERLTSSRSSRPARAVLLDQPDGAAGHPFVDLLDEPEALRGGEEGAGRQELTVEVDHAQQQLVLRDLVFLQVQDRLRVEGQTVVVDRTADALGKSGLHALGAPDGVLDDDPIAARLLGVVHRRVRLDEELVAGLGVGMRDRRDPDARGDADPLAVEYGAVR
jgi:hypothetical protein